MTDNENRMQRRIFRPRSEDMTGDGRNYWRKTFMTSSLPPKIIMVKCRERMSGTYNNHGRYELDVNKCVIDNLYVSMSFGELIYIHVFLCIVLWYVDTGLPVCPRDHVKCLMHSIWVLNYESKHIGCIICANWKTDIGERQPCSEASKFYDFTLYIGGIPVLTSNECEYTAFRDAWVYMHLYEYF
jgi:hypothetical protein